MGRKAINIDKEQFEDLLELQCTKEDISGFFHCSNDTIERWCRKTYGDTFSHVSDDYRSIGRVSLRRSQFAMAKTNPQMAIHLGKQYLGQTDKTETKLSGAVSVKHGNISRVIYYDPATKEPTEERVNGAPEDVDAFIEDPENYNGDTIAFMLPNKDPDPADLEGEMTHVSPDGTRRYHIPWDGREDPGIEIVNCETGEPIKYPDPDRIELKHVSPDGTRRYHIPWDGREDPGIEIVNCETGEPIKYPDPDRIELKHVSPDGTVAILEDYDDGRGGYTDPPAGADIEITTPDVKYRWKSNGRGGYLPR